MCVSTRIPFDNNLSEMQMGGEHLSLPVIRFGFVVQIAGDGTTEGVGGCTVVTCVITLLLITIMFVTGHHAILLGSLSSSHPRITSVHSPLFSHLCVCHFSGLCQHLELTCLVTDLARAARARACANRN